MPKHVAVVISVKCAVLRLEPVGKYNDCGNITQYE